jgi:hypothetical protein
MLLPDLQVTFVLLLFNKSVSVCFVQMTCFVQMSANESKGIAHDESKLSLLIARANESKRIAHNGSKSGLSIARTLPSWHCFLTCRWRITNHVERMASSIVLLLGQPLHGLLGQHLHGILGQRWCCHCCLVGVCHVCGDVCCRGHCHCHCCCCRCDGLGHLLDHDHHCPDCHILVHLHDLEFPHRIAVVASRILVAFAPKMSTMNQALVGWTLPIPPALFVSVVTAMAATTAFTLASVSTMASLMASITSTTVKVISLVSTALLLLDLVLLVRE